MDEESGGFAGLGWLAENGIICSKSTDYVIIPEPFGKDRVCLGHRGVYWFKVTALGKIAHGSMPFLGKNAIQGMGRLLESMRQDLLPALRQRKTRMPVVPPEARKPTLNINSIIGGQNDESGQSPCVADRCEAIFDRRFLPEENFHEVRHEIKLLLAEMEKREASLKFDLQDLMMVPPVSAPQDCQLVRALDRAAVKVLDQKLEKVASPGTYDHKHVYLRGGIVQCVAFGPGKLELAHQPDEYCSIADMGAFSKILALTLLDLTKSTP